MHALRSDQIHVATRDLVVSGVSVAGVGDVNKDGYDDVATAYSTTYVYVYHGSSSGVGTTAKSSISVNAS